MSAGDREEVSNLNFQAFTQAVQEAELGDGVANATCHHSAVYVKDWQAIQRRLKDAAGEVGDGQSLDPNGTNPE